MTTLMSSVKGRTLQRNVEQKKLVQKRLERVSVLPSENSRLFFSCFCLLLSVL